jgi:hypothetical protein
MATRLLESKNRTTPAPNFEFTLERANMIPDSVILLKSVIV